MNQCDLEPLLQEHNNNENNDHRSRSQSYNVQQSTSKYFQTKREYRLAQNEKCGRIRLAVLTVILFMFIFIFNLSWNEKQFYVTIPEDDKNWPGPKDSNKTTNTIINKTTHTSITSPSINTTTDNNLKNIVKINVAQFISTTTVSDYNINLTNSSINAVPKGFIVYGSGCQIPDFDPLEKNVMKLYHKEKYEECFTSKKQPITRLVKNYTTDEVVLVFDEELKKKIYGGISMKCCYHEIVRSGEKQHADNDYTLTKCTQLKKTMKLPSTIEYILIKCKDHKDKTVYVNAHAIIRKRKKIEERVNNYRKENRTTSRNLSVLMLGIDSISRLNLIRAMPHTAQYLYNKGWFELKGYNKVDDNTFPNLMAVLTGYNRTLAYNKCAPTVVGKLEQCPFVWKDFKDNGYVTGYAEDQATINTFNYNKRGFIEQPTDYYLRPFALAAEKYLPSKIKSTLKFCLGYKHYADYIYDYAMDFATSYTNETYFGLFWTNTFSHNAISDPSSMDIKIRDYLMELEKRGIFNDSAVIFFSDHGLRFGPIRQLETGWLEERLPFMFISLPEWFKNLYPDYINNLKINRNRLTNPYDLHQTLKHIINLSNNSTYSLTEAESCKSCQSIFEEVSNNRSCKDAEIESHWCTCTLYKSINKNSAIVKSAVKFILNYINIDLLENNIKAGKTTDATINHNELVIDNGKKCATLKLKDVQIARKGKTTVTDVKNQKYDSYLIVIETTPGDGLFETTLSYSLKTLKFQLTGSISRLNSYDTQSRCVHVDYLRKYCFCMNQ